MPHFYMKSNSFWTYFLLVLVVDLVNCAKQDDRVLNHTGPWGFLGYCPGSTKPVHITDRSAKRLTLSIQGPGLPFIANRTTYGFNQMKLLAKNPYLDFRRKTVVYVGGYGDHPNLPLARLLGKLYNDLGYNFLALDLNWFSTFMFPLAARNMRAVGVRTAEMLVQLVNEGLEPSKLELLGLSLGGQTISFIAKSFYKKTGRKIGRLTALDPSGPCFRHLGPENRLDSSDAEFVEIVMTNSDSLGTNVASGHVNFFVNGGEYQPADIFFLLCEVICSHLRVFSLWVSALIHTDKFIAIKCDSLQQARNHDCYDRTPLETNVLGVNVNRSNHGIFYLATDNNFPYFLGNKGVKKEFKFWDSHLEDYNLEDVVEL